MFMDYAQYWHARVSLPDRRVILEGGFAPRSVFLLDPTRSKDCRSTAALLAVMEFTSSENVMA